jgi:GntR family transcriptional regulator, trigonelline degradation regulator
MENDPKLRSVDNDINIEGLDEFSAHVPLREAVARTLKRAILDGSLRPGQPISENKIANKLSVSRTPVREAVRMLETEDLVTLLPGRKVIISIPTVQDIEDVYETRLIIESEALRRITPDRKELIQELEGYTHAAQEHLKQGNFIELEKVNTSFHLAILSALENRTIREFMASLHNKIARLRSYSLTDKKWAAEWEREHQRIIAHLKRGEIESAVDVLHQHLITPKQLLIKMFSERSSSEGSQ